MAQTIIPQIVEIEGCDGTGKTILCRRLAMKYEHDTEIIVEQEPWDTNYRDELLFKSRVYGKLGVAAFTLDRVIHWLDTLDKGVKYLISDRYLLSTLVYQCRNEEDNQFAYYLMRRLRLPLPTYTILLVCEPEVLMQRLSDRGLDKENVYDPKKLAQITQLQGKYIQTADANYEKDKIMVVNTSERTPQNVYETVQNVIDGI